MQDNIPDTLIAAFERHYDCSWNDPALRNERLAWRAAWAEATKPCLHQIQEPAHLLAVQPSANLSENPNSSVITIPHGWKLVPDDATPEWVANLESSPVWSEAVGECIKKFLAAAPAAPQAVPDKRAAFELAYATEWKKNRAGNETVEQLAAEIVAWREGETYPDDMPYLKNTWDGFQWARAALAATPAADAPAQTIERQRMTAGRASFFMERFLREEKLLGPNEQAALHFVIDMLEAAAAPVVLPEPLSDKDIDTAVYAQCPDFDAAHDGPSIDDMRAIVRALLAQAATAAAPHAMHGYKLVPVDLTPEMKREFMDLLMDGIDIYVNSRDQIEIQTDAPRRIWKAVLALSPVAPAHTAEDEQEIEHPDDEQAGQHFVSDCDCDGIQYHGPSYERGFLTGKTAAKDEAAEVAIPALTAVKFTEEMHVAAVKVLNRAHGVDGLPLRMLNAMLAVAPAHPAEGVQAVEQGEVLVTVSGFTGSGKSAIAGEIEILCRALGLQVEWPDGAPEKNLTHADWTAALEQYKPRVHIVEQNIPFAAMKGMSK